MSSLVGYGVSSDSDSDEQDGHTDGAELHKEATVEDSAVHKPRNFLLDPDSASSDSEPEVDPKALSTPPPRDVQTPCRSTSADPHFNKLPSPPLKACSNTSVFANPFKAQTDQTLNALQKHVPLTMQAKPSQIGGKKMCVSYRKNGRCRFGIKCKFAHDSDLQTAVIPTASHQPGSSKEPVLSVPVEMKEVVSDSQQGKKKRVGLSDTLVPPKKAMKQFAMQRQREQLHMS